MTAETVIGAVPAQAEFRTCQYTGLKVDTAAQALIKANAVAAVVFLAIGGLMGLLVALTRWPAVHLLPADWFYLILTGHGANVLLFWIIFFEIAVLYFASAILLNSRIAAPKLAWVGFVMMVVGAIATNVAVLQGDSSVMFTSYPPMKAQPHFYLGLILFAVGALIGCVIFFATLAIAKDEKTYEGSIPLVTFGALTAAIIAVFTIASGAIILIPTWLWSLGLISDIDPLMYRVVWWAMGHSSQQINVSAQVSLWYLTAALLVGAKPLSEKVSRTAFFMYILFLQLASAHHLLADPGAGCELEDRQHQLHDVSGRARLDGPRPDRAGRDRSGAAQERLQSRRVRMAAQGAVGTSGLRRHVPVAGVLRLHRRHLRRRARHRAAQRADAQHDLRAGPLPRHRGRRNDACLHGRDLPRAARWCSSARSFGPKLAKIQPYLFGIGVAGISLFMMGAGTLGVPRRHWDITFSDASLPFAHSAGAFLMMGLNGIFAIIAAIGGVIFVLVVVGTVFFGEKIDGRSQADLPAALRRRCRGLALRQRGGTEASGHGDSGHDLLRLLRPLLLHQLEISVGTLAVPLITVDLYGGNPCAPQSD